LIASQILKFAAAAISMAMEFRYYTSLLILGVLVQAFGSPPKTLKAKSSGLPYTGLKLPVLMSMQNLPTKLNAKLLSSTGSSTCSCARLHANEKLDSLRNGVHTA